MSDTKIAPAPSSEVVDTAASSSSASTVATSIHLPEYLYLTNTNLETQQQLDTHESNPVFRRRYGPRNHGSAISKIAAKLLGFGSSSSWDKSNSNTNSETATRSYDLSAAFVAAVPPVLFGVSIFFIQWIPNWAVTTRLSIGLYNLGLPPLV